MNMNLESELRMNLKAMTYDLQTPNPLKSLDEKKAIIEKYVQNLLDMLQERDHGEREGERESCESNYEQLFGTPERVADFVMKNCRWDCYACPFEGNLCGKVHSPNLKDRDAMLEWLRGCAK